MDDIRIHCPKCDWEPAEHSRWGCTCGHSWNTFDTGGRCPNCKKVWEDTQCLSCKQWSPHLDWYDGLEAIIQQLKKELKESWLATA